MKKEIVIILVVLAFLTLLFFVFAGFLLKNVNLFSGWNSTNLSQSNDEGDELIENEEYEKAIEHYLSLNETGEKSNQQLYNLAYCYFMTDNLEQALIFIDQCISKLPNNNIEFELYGDILLYEGSYESALEKYDLALSYEESLYAYSGKALTYNYMGDYANSLVEARHALEIDENSIDALDLELEALVYLGSVKNALMLLEKQFEIEYDYYYLNMLEILCENTDYKNDIYDTICRLNNHYPGNQNILSYMAKIPYLLGDYKNALENANKYIALYPSEMDGYVFAIYSCYMSDLFSKASEYKDNALLINSTNFDLNMAIGHMYYYQYEYKDASRYYETALENALEENDVYDAYYWLIDSLINGYNYNDAITHSNRALTVFQNDIFLLESLGLGYYNVGEISQAKDIFSKIISLDESSEISYGYLASAYIAEGRGNRAKEVILEGIETCGNNTYYQEILNEILLREKPVSEQVAYLFDQYYLFDYNRDNITSFPKNQLQSEIDKIKNTDDLYTYIISGESYDYYAGAEYSTVSYKYIDKSTIYIKIDEFSQHTDEQFISIISAIEKSSDVHLIIDLRDNGGGFIDSANNILDALLPVCTSSYTIDRDGYITPYFSDKEMIDFNKISIIINENSASASEMLTLSLKLFSDNVTIYGKPSVGKGVGQYIYDNSSEKFIISLVSFYWSVKEINIHNQPIQPDKYLNSDNLDEVMSVILFAD
ncbi:MAG: hypothetical protein JXQ23_04160 [Clostridia bacterium]|nr:hypothetical protein [Clostridia bacterium]